MQIKNQLFIDGQWCDSSNGQSFEVINPATGGEVTVPARPEMAVPRISFSHALKDKAGRVELK